MTLKHDPQEDDPGKKTLIDAVEAEAENNLSAEPHGRGFCHRLWAEQKRILKEKYVIDWKTPSEMNPEVMFD